MFRRFALRAAEMRQLEETLHELVAIELSENNLRPGLWTKAFADAEGHERKARAAYIRYRVQSLKDEYLQHQDAVDRATAALREKSTSASRPSAPVQEHRQNSAERAWFEEEERLKER